jgi:hypothetical protein
VSIEIVVVNSSFIISALHAFVRRLLFFVKRHAPSLSDLSCGAMPASSVIRVAFFALGAAVGGGTVLAINASRKKDTLVRATAGTTQALPPTGNGPLVEVGVTGDPRLSSQAAGAAGPVLKYGNPGTYDTLLYHFC